MRKFHGLLFLGTVNKFDGPLLDQTTREPTLKENPEAKHSSTFLGVELLRMRFAEAVSLSSKIQQNKGTVEDVNELHDIIRDLSAGLSGMEIEFISLLPFPAKEPEFGDYDTLVEQIYKMRLRLAKKVLGEKEETK